MTDPTYYAEVKIETETLIDLFNLYGNKRIPFNSVLRRLIGEVQKARSRKILVTNKAGSEIYATAEHNTCRNEVTIDLHKMIPVSGATFTKVTDKTPLAVIEVD